MLDDDPECWAEVDAWIEAARVAHVMAHNRLGVMGHYYGGMLDIYSDLTQHCATFGGHIEMLEVDELAALRREVTAEQVRCRVAMFHDRFDVQPDCPPTELERAARTSVALDRLVADHDLGSLAYYYRGVGEPENEDAVSSIILGNSLLTARGIPVAGEIRDQERPGDEDPRHLRRRRLVHRVLRHRLPRRRRADGPRWSRASRHRRGQDESASARRLSRQGRAGLVGRDERAGTGR